MAGTNRARLTLQRGMMNRVRASLRRIGWIALHTVREALRQRLLAAALFLAFGLVAGARFARDFNFGAPELKFIADVGLGAIGLFGAVLAVGLTVQLFMGDLERGTVFTLLARPVGRAEFVVAKFLGVVVVVVGYCAVFIALLVVVLWARETELLPAEAGQLPPAQIVAYGAVLVAGLLLACKLALTAAMTLLIASYARTATFATLMGWLMLVICHLQPFARSAAHWDSFLSRLMLGAVAGLIPNFQLFAMDAMAAGRIGGVALYALGYVVACVALATVCFRHREL